MHKLDLTTPKPPTDKPQIAIESINSMVDDHHPESDNHDSEPTKTLVSNKPKQPMNKHVLLTFCLVAILAGVATGYGSYKLYARTNDNSNKVEKSPINSLAVSENVKNGDVFGSSADEFKDSPSGYLEAGGINGEGSHKLLRPGGPSQTVYLTSSVVDLDKLVGMEVRVWGETFKAQKAGWLMDVGKVEVINTDGKPPSEN